MMAQNLAQRIEAGEALSASTAHRLVELMQEAEEQVRQLSHSLMPMEGPEEPLPAALRTLCGRREKMGEVCCEAEIDESVPALCSEVKTHLYRVASEAVTNAAKHGDPDTICVELCRAEDALILRIQDDGTGFSADDEQSEGAGLRIMKHRASLVGASFHVDTAEGEGAEIRCRLPLSKARRDPGAQTDSDPGGDR